MLNKSYNLFNIALNKQNKICIFNFNFNNKTINIRNLDQYIIDKYFVLTLEKYAKNIIDVSSDIIKKAYQIANKYHAEINQKRKYTTENYITHLLEVFAILYIVGVNEDVLSSALLHDVIEDTRVDKNTLSVDFNLNVINNIIMLTNQFENKNISRKIRKKLEAGRLLSINENAKLIKMADIISNVFSLEKYDLNFSKIYKIEKQLFVNNITFTNNLNYKLLHELAFYLVNN